MRSRVHKLNGRCQGVNKACAGAREIKAPCVPRPDFFLENAGGGREEHVRRDCRDNDAVNLQSRNTTPLEQPSARFRRQIGGGDALFDHVTLPDTGTRADPFIGGIQEFFQVFVGDDLFRNVMRCRRDFRVVQEVPPDLQNEK